MAGALGRRERRPGVELWRALPGSEPLEGLVDARVWRFEYAVEGSRPLAFKIYLVGKDVYFIRHAGDSEIPVIRRRLGQLWSAALDPKRSAAGRVAAVGEFEWLWFWANPYGRAGATTGDALSLLLQKALRKDGLPVRIRSTFRAQDLRAIPSSVAAYKAERAAELLP